MTLGSTVDAVAMDTITGLIWMRFAIGQEWKDDGVSGSPEMFMDMDDILPMLELVSESGWRLPTIDELKTLITKKKNDETFINNRVFDMSECYLSFLSSTYDSEMDNSLNTLAEMGVNSSIGRSLFTVDFSEGSVNPMPSGAVMSHIRLVRDGQ